MPGATRRRCRNRPRAEAYKRLRKEHATKKIATGTARCVTQNDKIAIVPSIKKRHDCNTAIDSRNRLGINASRLHPARCQRITVFTCERPISPRREQTHAVARSGNVLRWDSRLRNNKSIMPFGRLATSRVASSGDHSVNAWATVDARRHTVQS